MMNWKNIVFISVMINIILIIGLLYKYNISNHSSTEKLDDLAMNSRAINNRAIRQSTWKIESYLQEKPSLKKDIYEGVEAIKMQDAEVNGYIDFLVTEIESIKNDTGGIDLERRLQPYRILQQNNRLDSLRFYISSWQDSIDNQFDKMILDIRKELKVKPHPLYEQEIKNNASKIDIEAKIKSLKNISVLETRLVLHSLQLDVSNMTSIYINAIENILPYNNRSNFEKLKVVVLPRSSSVKLGEKYEAELAVAAYFPSWTENATLDINGKKYPFGKDGLVHYKETPQKVGKRILKLEANVTHSLTGAVMRASSNYIYDVVE